MKNITIDIVRDGNIEQCRDGFGTLKLTTLEANDSRKLTT